MARLYCAWNLEFRPLQLTVCSPAFFSSFSFLFRQVFGIVLVLVSQLSVLQTELKPDLARFAKCDSSVTNGTSVQDEPVSDMTHSAVLVASLAGVMVGFFVLLFRAPYRRVAAEKGIAPSVPLKLHY